MNIQLFGSFDVTHTESTGSGAIAIKSSKSRTLLAWLAAHRTTPQTRDRLSSLLWADTSEGNARTSLRQTLATLRRELPANVIVTSGDTVALHEDVSVDLEQFRHFTKHASRDQRMAATSLFRGELLEGFRSRSEGFDDWLLVERENVRRQAIDLLQGLLQHPNAPAQDIALCQQLLAIDPLNEDAHRQLMRAYMAVGEPSSALRQFQLCEEALRRELSSPPSMETVQLMRAIKSGNLAAESRPATPSGHTEKPTSPSSRVVESTRAPTLPSIAVLPFASMSADVEHEYLADGMTEELINLLAQSVNWRVAARNSSFRYKDQHIDVRDVGSQLGVGYIVEGSIRRIGERIRVTAQLLNTADGTHIWSDRYDRVMSEIFDVQDEVVHAIFRTLKNRIGFAERERVRRTQTANLDAWGLLIKAGNMQVSNKTTRDEQRALVYEALSIDPDYPRAHAYLASILFTSVGRGYTSDARTDYKLAHKHADAALAVGQSDVVVLKSCAAGYAAVGRSTEAVGLAERAFELSGAPDPLLVAVLMWNGRIEEAYEHCQQIVSGMPSGVPAPPGELRPIALLGNLEMLRGEFEAAEALAIKDLRANPSNYFAHANLANVRGYMNKVEDAKNAWEKAKELMPALTVEVFKLGYKSVFVEDALAEKFCAGLNVINDDAPTTTTT